ncbi:MAG TPA: ABC transporter ATP-binding protein [bacterium]|nr:ABC transporter ATP-binding protein [bacterium]
MQRQPEVDPLQDATGINLRRRAGALLMKLYRQNRRGLLGGAATVTCAVLLQIPLPWITRNLIDSVLIRHSTDLLVPLVAAASMLFIIRSGMSRWISYHFHVLQTRLVAGLQKRLIHRVFRLPMALYDQTATGYLMSRISGDSHGVSWFFSQGLVHVAADLLRMLVSMVIVFMVEPRLGCVVLAGLPVMIGLSEFWARRVRNMSLFSMESQAQFLSGLQESVRNMPLIRIFAAENRMEKTLGNRVDHLSDLSIENHAIQAVSGTTMNAVPSLVRLIVLAGGGYLVFRDIWSIGDLYAYQAYIAWIIGPAIAVAQYRIQYARAVTSLERTATLLDVIPEDATGEGVPVDRIAGDIEFRNTRFSYDGTHHVIDGFSAQIPKASHVAITGISGIGKSTLISLILGFYLPSHGEVLIDGRPVHTYNLSRLRRRIGVVPQQTGLFRTTIRENIRLGRPDAPAGAEDVAAEKACLGSLIRELPRGMDTMLAEGGSNLSEGQRQRIAIARALLIDPDILILDEPFSALDRENAETILSNILDHCREKTVIIVSHQIEHLRKCCITIRLDHSVEMTG